MSSSDIFQQVRAAVDIVEVIGEHVALKRAGREFKGLCPFHDDHRPSMAVVPHKQIFHCFVCGTGGDVFKFVKEFHKMSNGEALRMLAQRAGIQLPEWKGSGRAGQPEGPSIREQIAQANEWACAFFEKHLRSAAGKAGLDYLHARGLTDETIARFRLGMSPDSWTGLVNAALRFGLSSERLEQAGLAKKRSDGSLYDAFRNRVIFPIIDSSNRVIAFGGRILEEKRDEAGNVIEAKYLNSPETRLFIKSESVYGLNFARQQIIRTRTAVVVEGYMDVIACHQAGVTNVIATLGTALTPEHARLLKNYAQTIVLVFDSDDAGYRAADRALEVFVRGSLDIKLASVPDGKDPCDFCMKNGGEPFQRLVDQATDALAYKWQRLQRDFHATDSLTGRQEAVTQLLRFVATAIVAAGPFMDPVRKGLLHDKIARLVAMPILEVQQTLTRLARSSAPLPARETQGDPSPADAVGPGFPSGASTVASENQRSAAERPTALEAAEAWVLGALLAQPPVYATFREEISLHLFSVFRPLAACLLEYLDHHDELAECSLADLTGSLEDAELVRQAIELERRIADWLEPSGLSADHVTLLQHLAKDRGNSLEALLRDSLKELQAARGQTDPAVERDLGAAQAPAPNSAVGTDMAWFEQIKQRNQRGGNPRVVG